MVTQVPLFSTPLPDPLNQTSGEFSVSATTLVSEINSRFSAANTQASEVNAMALNVDAAVGELANAVWVSGTTYTAGQVRYSPIDSLMYRRRTNGSGTTDPSLDPTNWALQTKTSAGGSDTTSSAVDITLTSTSGRLQIISMTAANKKVTLPAANTLSKGTPIFVIKNSGIYRFAIRKNGGVFLCYVNPGQVIAFGCSDISTAAGLWTVSGDRVETIFDGNTAEVLNAVDSSFIAVAMLSATKAICAFKNNSTGYLWAVILNYGSASGAPIAVNAEAVRNISIAAQTSTQATVVYQINSGGTTVKGYVLDVSGNTITPGAVATIHTNVTSGATHIGTSITALSSTQLLCVYLSAGSGTIKERILDISGSTITPSSEVVADTTNVQGTYIYNRMIASNKAIVCGATSTQIFLRLQSVTGSTPSPTGSVLTIVHDNVTMSSFDIVVLSATRAAIVRFVNKIVMVFIVDISGVMPVLISSKALTVTESSSISHAAATKLDANRIYVTWSGGYSLGADGIVLTITGDGKVVRSEIDENIEPGITASLGYLACSALDASHVMQVCRNASTFLSAKTLEIN